MTGAFTPHPGAASLPRQVVAQAGMESRLLLRNGEQLVLALVIPVVVLLAAVYGAEHVGLTFSRPVVDEVAPGVMALAVMSTSFASLAIATGFERRYGVLKWLGSSPLPRVGMLLGKVLALLAVEAIQVLVITGVALLLGWSPVWSLSALPVLLLGTAAFASLGLLLAGTLRAEATLAAANLVYLLLLVGGGVVLPTSAYGGFAAVVRWLPSGALGDGSRAALWTGSLDGHSLLVLGAWAALGTLLTTRTFRWE